MVRKRVSILNGGIRIFLDTHCFDRAAAISFYAFFSLIPILLLLTAGLGFILGTRADLLDSVIEMARAGLPYISDRVVSDLRGLATAWRTFGWLSILMLILSAELVLNSLAEALISIFEMRKRFGFFRKKIVNFIVMFMGILAALVSIMVTTVAGVLRSIDTTVFGVDLGYYLIDSLAIKYVLPFVIMVSATSLVFKMFSGAHLSFLYAFYGSLVFTFVWEFAKHMFALYISYFPYYNKFYGSLGTIMILLLWLFFTAAIFLFSASVARSAYRCKLEDEGIFEERRLTDRRKDAD
jgi:membrane protein